MNNVAPSPFDIEANPDGTPGPAASANGAGQGAPPPPPAATEDRPPPPPPRRPHRPTRARPRGGAPGPAYAPPSAASPGPTPYVSPFDAPEEPVESREMARDLNTLYTRTFYEHQRKGWPAEDLRLCIDRTHQNGHPIEKVTLTPELSGLQVQGDPDRKMTPGDQLQHIVTHTHHRGMPEAVYVLRIMSKSEGKTIKVSTPLRLESYAEIERKEAEIGQQRQQPQRAFGGQGYGAPGYPYGAPAAPAAAPLAAPAGMDPFTKALLDSVLEQLNTARAELARQRGEVAPARVTIPEVSLSHQPPPAAAPIDPEEAFIRSLERTQRLQRMLAPAQPAFDPATIPQLVMRAVVTLQEQGVVPKPGAVAPAAAAATPGAVPPAGPAPGSIEWLLAAKEAENDLLRKLRRAYPNLVDKEEIDAARNVEDAPRPPVPSQVVAGSGMVMGEPLRWVPFPNGEEDGMGWKEWFARMLADNPKRAGDILGRTLQQLAGNEGLIRRVMKAFNEMSGQDFGGGAGEAPAQQQQPPAAGGGWSPPV